MIETFAIMNYKSIRDILVVDFKAQGKINESHKNIFKEVSNDKLSKLNFFYGKNGAGKSTVISALEEFKRLVTGEKIFPHNRKQAFRTNIRPFKITATPEKITLFSMVFVTKGFKYRYTISFDNVAKKIDGEQLEVYKDGFELLYSKEENGFDHFNNDATDRLLTYNLDEISILKLIGKEVMINNKELQNHIINAYSFFTKILFGFKNVNQGLEDLYNNKELQKLMGELVGGFDLSINDISVEMRELSFQEYVKRYDFLDISDSSLVEILEDRYKYESVEYYLKFSHKGYDLIYSEESSGTKKIINILFSILSSDETIWIIDDFDNDLHPEVSKEFLKYLSYTKHNSQFIFVTHQTDILDMMELKNKNLHYFIEKDLDNLGTRIEKLINFSDLRSDERHNWSNFYSDSRLGQYPEISINDSKYIEFINKFNGDNNVVE